MDVNSVKFKGSGMKVYSLNTVIVGTGAAGLNAADRLYAYGQKDIAIVTEGLLMGTSRNTGADKQTYYKLTLAGNDCDSIFEMAKTFYECGCMHGDIALVESALSPQCFYHLVDIGVPFPHNRYGEYIGYKTDHDPKQRATSAGPLTSRFMTENLQKQVEQKAIKIFDKYQVIAILTDKKKENAIGLLTLNLNELENPNSRYVLFNSTNVIYATGGPAGVYLTSVYPTSQTGASGLAFEAGVRGRNLTESQFGIASIKFRWNLSGTYQQVLPRYISTDINGNDEKEFLDDYFNNTREMLDAIFLKGYQWPFDPRKLEDYGSSIIDILVYNETNIERRRVFLDYTKNPSAASKNGEFDFSVLGREGFNYLKNSNALFGKPIDRLALMNQPAIDLYKNNGIDLRKEYLEVAVCAQHNNGGLYGNIWWESNLKHFFPVGEVNGSHGVYRPGGSALNSGQVGSTRAAKFIAARYKGNPISNKELLAHSKEKIEQKIKLGEKFLRNSGKVSNVLSIRKKIGKRMDDCGAIIRSIDRVHQGMKGANEMLSVLSKKTSLSSIYELPYAFQNYDLAVTQYVYLSAIANYIENGGQSRGSYLVYNPKGNLPTTNVAELFRFSLDNGKLIKKVQEVVYENGECKFEWKDVRPLPQEEDWFENIWNAYMRDEIIDK